MKKLLAVAALLCVASVASASMDFQVAEVTDADHASRGLRAFDVTMVGTVAGADEFNAIDGALTGDLVQCWAASGGIKTVDPSGFTIFPSALAEKLDTHLLIGGAAVIVAVAPEEDSNLPGGSVENFDTFWQRGQGTRLSGPGGVNFAFAVQASAQALSTPLMRVVVPATSNANLTATLVAKNGAALNIDHDFIPEPATLGLLAVGGIGALIRRRRR